jgi:hypothetical protein
LKKYYIWGGTQLSALFQVQQKLHANKRILVWRKFVFLTGIPEAAMIGVFDYQQAYSFDQ